MIKTSLEHVKSVNRVIWIETYDEDQVMDKITSTFKDYRIHIWNPIQPSLFGITMSDEINSELSRFILLISQRFMGRDVLVIMDFKYYCSIEVLRAIKLSKSYLDKKDCYIVCVSPPIQDSEIDMDEITSTITIVKLDIITEDDVIDMLNKICEEYGIKNRLYDDDVISSLTSIFKSKSALEKALRIYLKTKDSISISDIAYIESNMVVI